MVAPDIGVHADPSGDDCHWYVFPVFVVAPVSVRVAVPEPQRNAGADVVVPGVGVQSGAPAT